MNVDSVAEKVSSSRTRPSRDATQAKLTRRSIAAQGIKPADPVTIADRVEAQARQHGERPFLYYGDACYSYADLDREANRFANALSARGVRKGDVVALALENRPAFYFAWFGAVKIGAVVAFLNTQIRGRPLSHAIASVAARAVVLGEECLENFVATQDLPQFETCFLPDPEKPADAQLLAGMDQGFARELAAASTEPPPRSLREGIRAEMPTLLIFTSGTTGLPKAARYSHMRWLMSGDVMVPTIDAVPNDVFYCCLPLYHGAAATSATSTALAAGAAIALRRKFSARAFWDDIRRYRVTIFQYVGEICRYLLNAPTSPRDRDHALRGLVGAGFTAETWRRWVERFGQMSIYEGWGSTESNTNLINVDDEPGAVGRVPYWDKTNFRLIRYDVENGTHIRDENGFCVQCAPGEVGEGIGMIINHPEIGGGRFEGYTSDEATEKKILRDVFQKGDAWWSSGDLLRYDEDGYCYFVDRIGDTYRWKSENVSTLEVSEALSDFEGAELINIYGVKVPGHEGRAGMAAIVMQAGHRFDPDRFYALTEARLPRYAAPLFVRIPEAADLTTTFKLRKVDLQAQGYDNQAFADPLYVRDDQLGTYRPYSSEVLAELGLPPFSST